MARPGSVSTPEQCQTAGTLLNFSYQYDKVGNITQITNTAVTPNDTQDFSYDHLGWLKTAGGTNPAYYHTYSYGVADQQQLGNLTRRTETIGSNIYIYDYTYDPNHKHAVRDVSGVGGNPDFLYDANGNMTGRTDQSGNFSQVFDVENRLVSVVNNANEETTTFTYDASGQRVKTVEPNGTVTHYPFPFYEVESPGQPSEVKRTTYSLGGQAIALRVVGGSSPGLYYVHADHLGSTSQLTNSSGGLAAGTTARYLPFGKYRVTPTAGLTDRGFTGHRHQDELGLIYMNARWYVPGVMRFASADTIVPDPKNPQLHNRYNYVLNSPLRYTDPTGHYIFEEDPTEPDADLLPLPLEKPLGLNKWGEAAWAGLQAIQEQEDAWWGEQLGADEAIFILARNEFGDLLDVPEVRDVIVNQYNNHCSDGPWSSACLNKFWGYSEIIREPDIVSYGSNSNRPSSRSRTFNLGNDLTEGTVTSKNEALLHYGNALNDRTAELLTRDYQAGNTTFASYVLPTYGTRGNITSAFVVQTQDQWLLTGTLQDWIYP